MDPLKRPWPVALPLYQKINLTGDLTYVYTYRYRWSDEGTWLQDWTEYTPGSITIYVNNDTVSVRNLYIETNVKGYLGARVMTETDENHTIIVNPTPQFSFTNWQITPSAAQESGTWTWSVDLTSTPTYTGTDTFVITIDGEYYDGDDVLIDSDTWTFSSPTATLTGSFTLPVWEAANIGLYGTFDFVASMDITNATAITNPVTDTQIWDDKWLGQYIVSADCFVGENLSPGWSGTEILLPICQNTEDVPTYFEGTDTIRFFLDYTTLNDGTDTDIYFKKDTGLVCEITDIDVGVSKEYYPPPNDAGYPTSICFTPNIEPTSGGTYFLTYRAGSENKIAKSNDLITWEVANQDDLNSTSWTDCCVVDTGSGDRVIVVGNGSTNSGQIQYSDDGVNWTFVSGYKNLYAVDVVEVSGSTYVVAAGYGSTMEFYWSDDYGATWNDATYTGTPRIEDLAVLGSRIGGVSYYTGDKFWYSDNGGQNWSSVSVGTTNLRGVTAATIDIGGTPTDVWVAVGDFADIFTSTDNGITWTETFPGVSYSLWETVVYDPVQGLFIASGFNFNINTVTSYYSPDGSLGSWVEGGLDKRSWLKLSYVNSKLIGIASSAGFVQDSIILSENCIDNDTQTITASISGSDMAPFGVYYWSVEGGYYSNDTEVNWTATTINSDTPACSGQECPTTPVEGGETCSNPIIWSDTSVDQSLGGTYYLDPDSGAYGVWIECDIDAYETILAYADGEDTYIHDVRYSLDCSGSYYPYFISTYDDYCSANAAATNTGYGDTIVFFVGEYGGGEPSYEIVMKNITSSGCP